ncbi:DUF4236 domain-containing protein [Chryseobacterium koreense]
MKIAPGIRINLSKGGISTSVGVRGAKMTIADSSSFWRVTQKR